MKKYYHMHVTGGGKLEEEKTLYENLGIDIEDVCKMEQRLEEILSNPKFTLISEVLNEVMNSFPDGMLRYYAFYQVGMRIENAHMQHHIAIVAEKMNKLGQLLGFK